MSNSQKPFSCPAWPLTYSATCVQEGCEGLAGVWLALGRECLVATSKHGKACDSCQDSGCTHPPCCYAHVLALLLGELRVHGPCALELWVLLLVFMPVLIAAYSA